MDQESNQGSGFDESEEQPTAEFLRGIKEFNEGEFFECHETLEQVWKGQISARREFTQGIIQTAVAFYHLKRENHAGAIKLFHRALPRLRKFGADCFGVDVLPLVHAVEEALKQLEAENPPDGKLLTPPTISMIK